MKSLLRRTTKVCAIVIGLLGMSAAMVACKSQTPDERLQEAQTLLAERQTARGVIKLKELIRDEPDDPATGMARLQLAHHYTQEADAARALEQLEYVFENYDYMDPRFRGSMVGIIAIRQQLGQYEEALAILDRVLEEQKDADPTELANMRMGKATLLLTWSGQLAAQSRAEGKPELEEKAESKRLDAVSIMDEVAFSDEETSIRHEAREQLANYYRMSGDYKASNMVYERYIATHPDEPVVIHLRIAMALNMIEGGEKEEGDKLFKEAAQEFYAEADNEIDKDRRAEMLLNLGDYYARYGDLDKAEELMRRVMGENTRSLVAIQTQFKIGSMYMNVGQFDKAQEIFEQIKRENPDSNIEQNADSALKQLENIKTAMAQAQQAAQGGEEAAPSPDTEATEEEAPEE